MVLNVPSKFLKCDSEVFREVYSYLSDDDQNQMHKVAEIVHGSLLSWSLFHRAGKLREYVRKSSFCADRWESCFGKVEKIRLPLKIYDILRSPCPFYPGKEVQETHILVYLPKTVDGKPLTLNSFEELVKNPKKSSRGNRTQYRFFSNQIKDQYGNQASEPCWILMTKDVIPGSRKKSFDTQRGLIPSGQGYQVPRVLEAVAVVFLVYIGAGRRFFSDDPWTYTRCQEETEDGRVIVGGFEGGDRVVVDGFEAEAGLSVVNSSNDYDYTGLAVLQKFPGA